MGHKSTIVFTLFLDNIEYLHNLKISLKFYQQLGFDIVVVEQSSQNSAEQYLDEIQFSGTHIRFKSDIPGLYKRTEAINKGLSQCRTRTAYVCDVDAIVPHENLIAGLELLQKGTPLLYPYDRTRELDPKELETQDLTELIHAPTVDDGAWLPEYSLEDIMRIFIRPLQCSDFKDDRIFQNLGLVFGVNIESYFELGGENPFFLDWGFEDLERYERVSNIHSTQPPRLEGQCLHLSHTRRHRFSRYKINNFFEWRKVTEMTTEELQFYINTWPQQCKNF